MIRIEKKGRRIAIFSSEPLPGMRTAIPGAYLTSAGYWTVPLSIESCMLLKERYGGRLQAGTELERWSRTVQENRRSMSKLAASDDAHLEHLSRAAPELAEVMEKRRYQRVGAKFIADTPACLIADDPGLGKTLIAMGGILEAEIPGPYLVIAPKTAAETVWKREIASRLPREHRAVTLPQLWHDRDYKLRTTRYDKHTWLIVHPEICLVQAYWECVECDKRTIQGPSQQKQLDCGHIRDRKTRKIIEPRYPKLFEVKWKVVIVDESHESLIRRKGVPTQRRRGLDLLRDKMPKDGIRIALSGTPFDSKPHQLWGTLNWLDPDTYSAFYRWAELYWDRAKGGYTGFETGEFRADREKMLWDSLSAIALRRTKVEVAQDLPPKMEVGTPLDASESDSPVGIWLPMEGKQEQAYREIEELSVTELDSGRLEAISALAELTRLKQLACAYGDIVMTKKRIRVHPLSDRWRMNDWPPKYEETRYETVDWPSYVPQLPSNKFNWVVESLEEWGYPRNPLSKVVIVSFYTGILRLFARGIHKHFKIKKGDRPLVTGISGRTPSHKRKGIIDEFNRTDCNSPQIMMLNVKAGGTAITLDTADRMIFISETRIPTQQQQAEDRIHRISNPRQCWYYYLRSLDTVDIGTAIMNRTAISDTHRLLDQRRGVDYVRQVMELSHQRNGHRPS